MYKFLKPIVYIKFDLIAPIGMSDVLITNDLSKDYNTNLGIVRALDNLNIRIPKGATAFLGPNGSGKSTLIKIVLGLIRSTSGSFELFGQSHESMKLARNNIGYMPETPSIISKVNAVKFVRHFGILSGLTFTRSMQRAHEVLDYVGLHEERYREIAKYSTGMKQRLLFAQALIHDPEVIILDEPTSGLSPEGRTDMLELIKEIIKDYGKSIIFSTHILPDVEQICDYTVLINQGKEVFQGTIKDMNQILRPETIIEVNKGSAEAKVVLESKGYTVNQSGNLLHVTDYSQKQMEDISFQNFSSYFEPINVQILNMKSKKPNLEDLFYHLIDRDIDQYNGGN